MDLVHITNILKQLIKTHFQEENDLKMLMQLMELIVLQYKKNHKLPDFLLDEFCHLSSTRTSIDTNDLLAAQPSQVTILDSDLNRSSSTKRPRIENDQNELSFVHDLDRFNATHLVSFKSEPHFIEVNSINNPNSSIINETVMQEVKTELIENERTIADTAPSEAIQLQVDIINEQVKKPKKTPSMFNKIRHAWQELAKLLKIESPYEIGLFLHELNGLRLIQTQIRLINKTFYIDICTNILIIMGNIAEIAEFRKLLIKDDILFVLRVILNDSNDLVSYLSSRVIIHLIDELNESSYRLKAIESDLSKGIARWSSENIKKTYPDVSVDSLIRMLESKYQMCQKWSCWSLANMTNYDCEPKINELIKSKQTRRSVKDFARQILKNYS